VAGSSLKESSAEPRFSGGCDLPKTEEIPARDGYQLFRHDRNRHGGGVLLYIRDHLTAEVLPYDHTTNLEFLPLNISVFSHFVLVGDFNVNINNTSHHSYHKVCSLVDYFNFTQAVSGFTHTAPGGSTSLIDLVFTTPPPQILNCATIPPLDNPSAKSYHLTINCKPPADFQGSRPIRRTVSLQTCRLR